MKKNVIFTVMIGDNKAYPYVKDNFSYYAKKVDADIIFCETKTYSKKYADMGTYGVFGLERLHINELLNRYDRVLCVDSDIIIQPSAPNIFEEFSDTSSIYAFNEGAIESRETDIKYLLKILSDETFKWSLVNNKYLYFNVGVMLFSKEQQPFFNKLNTVQIEKVMPKINMFEQAYFNYIFFKHNFKIKDVGYKYNRMDMLGRRSGRKKSYFIHYAGAGYSENLELDKYQLLIEDMLTLCPETISPSRRPVSYKKLYFILRKMLYRLSVSFTVDFLNYY